MKMFHSARDENVQKEEEEDDRRRRCLTHSLDLISVRCVLLIGKVV